MGSNPNLLSHNSLQSNGCWDQIEARILEKEKLNKKKWNRFRPKTTSKVTSKTLLKSYDFGQLKGKPILIHKKTKGKNNDLYAITSKNTITGKPSIVTKTIDEISELN